MRRLALLLALASLAGSAVLVTSAPAAASSEKAPCWRTVINDWYDNGRIDHTYPIACYREALQNLPEDVQQYADAHDVINRALQAALLAGATKHGSSGPPPNGPSGGSGSQTTSTETETTKSSTTPAPGKTHTDTTPPPAQEHNDPVLTKAIKKLGPSDANSIPLPLVILGVLALVLLAAGAAGFVARKLQERRGLATPDGSPPMHLPPVDDE